MCQEEWYSEYGVMLVFECSMGVGVWGGVVPGVVVFPELSSSRTHYIST